MGIVKGISISHDLKMPPGYNNYNNCVIRRYEGVMQHYILQLVNLCILFSLFRY